MALPAWLASRVQVPAAVKLTAPEVMVQIEVDEVSTVTTTGLPEAPPLVVGV